MRLSARIGGVKKLQFARIGGNGGKMTGVRWPRLFRELADLCFPASCVVCTGPADSWPLCEKCLAELGHLESAAGCQRCGLPVPEPGAPCPRCRGAGLRPFASVLRLGILDDPIRQLIHGLKFHRAWGLGEFFAERLHRRASVKALLDRADVIAPVPLHFLRQWWRGYNQSDVIACRLARLCGKPVVRAVRRVVHTDAQTSMQSRSARMANLSDAFALTDPAKFAGKVVVVVDDVRTTGATLRAVGRCLRRARPAELHAVVVAVADPLRTGFDRV